MLFAGCIFLPEKASEEGEELNSTPKNASMDDTNDNELNIFIALEGEPKTREDLEKLFKAFDLEAKFNSIKPLVRSKIDVELIRCSESDIKPGQSKIGGKPDLPANIVWPTTRTNKSLSFIGQLNCAELNAHHKENLLPEEGLISFFYCSNQEAWGFDPKDADRFKVIYSESIENLERLEYPKDLEEQSIFRSNKLKLDESLSIPGWEHHSINGVFTDDEIDDYIEISSGFEHQILGYADAIQGPMELECQLVTNGLFCGDPSGYEDPRREELESGKDDWILLFQVNSDEENSGMMWGDEGKLYFWIKKQDLKDRNFDDCWFVLQCY